MTTLIETLTSREITALVLKSRSGKFGNHSDSFFAGLVSKGMIEPKTKRLTNEGRAAVETYRRLSDQN